jgi:hypothetical protein
MRYLLLIYENEQKFAELPAAESEKVIGEYMQFTEQIVKSGHFRGGDALQPTSTATTLRVREGKPLITDGPFAETREQLGGFYLIDAPHLDEAIAIAGRIPSARWGSIEIRPIMEFGPPEGA